MMRTSLLTRMYKSLHKFLTSLSVFCHEAKQTESLHSFLKQKFPVDTIIGHCLRKPFGYDGDFEIIDWAHTYRINSKPEFEPWDKFMQQFVAPSSVRSRSVFFREMVSKELVRNPGKLHVLNVACGSCRDLFPIIKDSGKSKKHPMYIENIDADQHAVDFASRLFNDSDDCPTELDFKKCNAFHLLRSEEDASKRRGRFNLVWSAGLFDYFDDRAFGRALNILVECCAPGGLICVGNISTKNPDREIMDYLLDWKLIHRTEEDLLRLARDLKNPSLEAVVDCESLGINHILCIRKSPAAKI